MPIKRFFSKETSLVDNSPKWDKTLIIKNRLWKGEKLEKKADGDYFEGRRIISRDTPILKGVYPGETEREAIVVDSEKDPFLKILYEKAKQKATYNGKVNPNLVMNAVFEVSKEAMPNMDLGNINDLKVKKGIGPDRKVLLGVFIDAKTGVCRHHALACGALLEMFKNEGHIRGTPSIDRNSAEKGSHAWCRYTNSAGEVFIIDPAQNFIGRLKDSKGKWSYHRPEDAK